MILQHCILPIANYIANYIRTYFILHNVIVCDFLVIAHAQCTSAIPCVESTFDSSFTSSPVCWTCVLPTFDSCTQEEPSAADLNCADQRLSMEGLVHRLVLLLQFTMHCIAMADDGGWSCYYNHNGTRWCLGLWTCRCCLAYKCSKTLLTAILNIFRIVNFLQQNEFRFSKTVLGNSFWSALTFSDILSLTFVALPGNACTYSGIVQILHHCLFKLHYNSILEFGFASSF